MKKVLAAWGPGKFDAELFLDGKGFRPDGQTAATLIPPAYGLAGVNLHTFTGWGSIPCWLGGVSLHGQGGYYHDGRFKTLGDVVSHYDSCLSLGLTGGQQSDLVAYLKSL